MVIIKFMSLVVAIWFSIVNYGLIKNNQSVPSLNLLTQAVCIAIFVFI